MTIRFYSIDAAPRTLPIWELILDDLGRPPAPRVARTLGVGASTVYRWNQAGSAPRMACLALFWLTRWGRSEIDCAAVNDCRLATSYAQSLESELRQAQQQLAHVLAISRPGSANDPLAQPRAIPLKTVFPGVQPGKRVPEPVSPAGRPSDLEGREAGGRCSGRPESVSAGGRSAGGTRPDRRQPGGRRRRPA